MGFFGSIKKNMNHGGVKLNLDAPASISMTKGDVPVNVTITASSAAAKINRVGVEILRSQNPQGSDNPGAPVQVSSATNTAPFTLQPGESKTIELKLIINLGKAAQDMLPAGGAMDALAKGLQMAEEVADAHAQDFDYQIRASADVDGISIDPAVSQRVQMVKPGQIGAAINKQINL